MIARVAARQMAATVTYANELKALAGVRAGGRRLEKPVAHYSLSWGPGEKPPHATMVNAARASPSSGDGQLHQTSPQRVPARSTPRYDL